MGDSLKAKIRTALALLGRAFPPSIDSVRGAASLNEVAALLVFSDIAAEVAAGGGGTAETLFNVSNSTVQEYVIRVNFFEGDESSATYCFGCDFAAALGSRATTTLSVPGDGSGGSLIRSMGSSGRGAPVPEST